MLVGNYNHKYNKMIKMRGDQSVSVSGSEETVPVVSSRSFEPEDYDNSSDYRHNKDYP